MLRDIPGYEFSEKIHESPRSLVYRGHRQVDGAPVIVKLLRAERPGPEDAARFKREYEIGRSLDLDSIVRSYAFEKINNRLAIVMEDSGAVSLKGFLVRTLLGLDEVLVLASRIAGALSDIHQRNIIHKDINPSNIIIQPARQDVKLIDFGIAAALSREMTTLRNLDDLEGTLGYISPEQTGRMSRTVDYRTDFYSLGATLYEMLVGEPPFVGSDAMELVHAHIARAPVPPHARRPELPPAVSSILLKLLAKDPEHRYQSGHGLQTDLEECLSRLRAHGTIPPFELGTSDHSDKFQIPQRLYGRREEAAILLSTFERVASGRAEMLLVAGYSGVGKSALVHEVHRLIVEKRGYFISGKFDQLQRDIPYHSLIQAFQELVRQLLSEPESRLRALRERLRVALGPNGSVITDVIREVEFIIGEQPPAEELPPAEAQHRFNFAFQSFVRAFTAAEHPLVIFLDDLQWADAPSLKLLQLLVSDASAQHLLVIGAYRDNEVSSLHPLVLALEALEKAGAVLHTLVLEPLRLEHVTELIEDTLKCGSDRSLALAQLALEKTDGNPFFLGQFLRELYDDGLIVFDLASATWDWDTAEIRRRSITDNVVELLTGRIRKLGVRGQHMLELAACIGGTFDLRTLCTVGEASYFETASGIWEALTQGLLVPVDESYQLAQPASLDVGATEVPDVSYRFLHDRVQQAAYSLIAGDSRQSVHLKVGRLLLKATPEDALDERIFDIVHQFSLGRDLINSVLERYTLARLNLRAARKAKASTAHEPALRYLTMALSLLPPEAWSDEYELTMTLHLEATEEEYLNGNFDRARELSTLAMAHARTLLEKVRVYESRVLYHTARTEYEDTIRVAMEALKLLGVELPPPEAVDMQRVGEALAHTAGLIGGRSAAELADLPEMTDPVKLATVRMLVILAAPTYLSNPMSFPIVACEMVNHCILYGNSRVSPYCFAIYGVILAGVVEDVAAGNAYGDLALRLLDKLNARELKAKVYTLLGLFVRHWKFHARKSIPLSVEAVQAALESGDHEYVGYATVNFSLLLFYVGDPLDYILTECTRHHELLARLKHAYPGKHLAIIQQLARCLASHSEDPLRMVGAEFDEDTDVRVFQEVRHLTLLGSYYTSKANLAYVFGDYPLAVEMAERAAPYMHAELGQITIVHQALYQSLSLLASHVDVDADTRQKNLETIERHLPQLKAWAAACPENFANKLWLVEAERHRVLGQVTEAMQAYDRAIELSVRHGYVQEEALAAERAGRFYLELGREKVAAVYLADARYAYLRWGAHAKVAQMEQQYPGLAARAEAPESSGLSSTTASTKTKGTELDLTTVIKAAQAISGEIVLGRLVDNLMRIAIENAGAQRGLLIIERDGAFAVQSEHLADSAATPASPDSSESSFSTAIIQYVQRTGEAVVEHHAVAEGMFASDPYVVRTRLCSVMCLPLLSQGKLMALLYLENNLATGVFTKERLEVLRILASQAVLSIYNATLYADLEQTSERLAHTNRQLEEYSHTLEKKVAERTAELSEKNQELAATLTRLRDTQRQLVAREKLASLGSLTAGIAHEIKNPLNFVNNFSALTGEMVAELEAVLQPDLERLAPETWKVAAELLGDLRQSTRKIHEHGRRADDIVQSMLLHSRVSGGAFAETDLNALLAESLDLAHQGIRSKAPSFPLQIDAEYDTSLGSVEANARQLSRVFINIINNAWYAMREKWRMPGPSWVPLLTVRTRDQGAHAEVCIRDNGSGIPASVLPNIFQPFFTTKPPGEGTGLGLSLSREIIVEGHKGELRIRTEEGAFTEFIITLPKHGAGEKAAGPGLAWVAGET